MENRKGISLSITAIVVIAVGVVVLLVVLGFFVGGFGRTGGAMRDVTAEAETTGGGEVTSGIGNIFRIWGNTVGEACPGGDDDCGSGMICHNSKCLKVQGQKCKLPADCVSNDCSAAVPGDPLKCQAT